MCTSSFCSIFFDEQLVHNTHHQTPLDLVPNAEHRGTKVLLSGAKVVGIRCSVVPKLNCKVEIMLFIYRFKHIKTEQINSKLQ